jgi:hypothetical protein
MLDENYNSKLIINKQFDHTQLTELSNRQTDWQAFDYQKEKQT